MIKIILALALSIVPAVAAVAENVPQPPDQSVRHHLKIPANGLVAFLKRPHFPVPMVSHHRGGPAPGFPENAIETMDNALKYGFGIMEVDVAQLKDGTLILMHDDTIGRTTNGSGALKKLTWDDIKTLNLVDDSGALTEFKVPLLRDVLTWAKGRAILTLDIKRGVNFKKVVELVNETGAQDYAAAIAYTINQAKTFHRLAPQMPMSIGLTSDDDIEAFDKSGIPGDLVIAWTGTQLLSQAHYKRLHARGWRVIVGTLGRRDTSLDNQIRDGKSKLTYADIVQMGADIIATDRFWAAQKEISNPNLIVYSQYSIAIHNASQ